MIIAEPREHPTEITPEAVREQLELVVRDPAFRSSKRSVEFLRYVVSKTLEGAADQIKERTIGVEVFGRDPSYDTNIDHVVRTAAIELRKRLSIYYGQDWRRSELRITLVPGSYIPHFPLPQRGDVAVSEKEQTAPVRPRDISPGNTPTAESEQIVAEPPKRTPRPPRPRRLLVWTVAAAVIVPVAFFTFLARRPSAQDLFWKPLLDMPGPVLIAAGDVPDGPPSAGESSGGSDSLLPILHRTSATNIPFSDAMTMARVLGTLQAHGRSVILRQDSVSSFSELRESPVVLIGAFNNQWTLRLTHRLRYSLALDPERHLIYIKDAKALANRSWSWATDQPRDHQGEAGRPPLQDFALISRIWNSDTGHPVVVIGGLYRYGTEAAGEFLNDRQLMQAIGKEVALQNPRSNIQIVLGTTVTDGTAGPPRILAVSSE